MTDSQLDKHLNTTFKVKLETTRTLFEDFTDNQRIELIKCLIWTSHSNHAMYDRVKKEILSPEFQSDID